MKLTFADWLVVAAYFVLNLLIGSIPGVMLGSRLCLYLPERSVRLALASTLLFSGLRLV